MAPKERQKTDSAGSEIPLQLWVKRPGFGDVKNQKIRKIIGFDPSPHVAAQEDGLWSLTTPKNNPTPDWLDHPIQLDHGTKKAVSENGNYTCLQGFIS